MSNVANDTSEAAAAEALAAPARLKEEKDCKKCERWKGKILRNSPMVRFMNEHLDRVGCALKPAHFKCQPCEKTRAGGFSPAVGIVLCQNQFANKRHMEDVMTHELIHAYDHCTTNIDWRNCEQHACAEIRANSLSGECKFTREFARGFFAFAKHHQACVKRRTLFTLRQLPGCREGKRAEDAIRIVWGSCWNDTAPFDEIA